MGTFADVLFAALRREEARGRDPGVKAPGAPAMVDLHASVAASLAAEDARPAWARTLGLSLGCDEEQVRRAYRRLVFETHPDRPGGSHEAFLAVRLAHDEAMAALRASRHVEAKPAGGARRAAPVRSYRATPRAEARGLRTAVAA